MKFSFQEVGVMIIENINKIIKITLVKEWVLLYYLLYNISYITVVIQRRNLLWDQRLSLQRNKL